MYDLIGSKYEIRLFLFLINVIIFELIIDEDISECKIVFSENLKAKVKLYLCCDASKSSLNFLYHCILYTNFLWIVEYYFCVIIQ